MKRILGTLKSLGRNLGFWILSLICEVPFYFFAGILVGVSDLTSPNHTHDWRDINFVLLVACTSLVCRLISLHLIGSWVLKRILIHRKVGPLGFGLSDFVLANLWVGVWAFLDPSSLASELFRGHPVFGFPLTEFWYLAIPPIALGSATFRVAFGTRLLGKNGKQSEGWNALEKAEAE